MNDFLAALALVAVIEGAVLFMLPNYFNKMAMALSQMSDSRIRLIGLFAIIIGLLFLWLVRS
tara:strand:- start:90 stop:275 length:186 start_codon:yes stop_codon:yes gene_type:complete